MKPSLRQHVVTGLAPVAKAFSFKLRALNFAGYTDSVPLSVVLSAIPDTPLTGPYSDSDFGDNTRMKIFYGPQAVSENGGSDILSYELQIDNGKGGDFRSLIGLERNSLETSYVISSGIVTGEMYRFRYRSKNINGYSGWSPITYVKAATVPSRPPAPTLRQRQQRQ